MALFSDNGAAWVGRCSIFLASAQLCTLLLRVTRDPWVSIVGC